MEENTCCFFGHREIEESEELREKLCGVIENLITEQGVKVFLFGSKSRFDALCLEAVTALKEKYPHIQRVYVRAEFPVIDDAYRAYLLGWYDETYYPEKIRGAGRAVYVERNCEMIDNSRYCVVFYNREKMAIERKSGTEIALRYAVKQGKEIVLLP